MQQEGVFICSVLIYDVAPWDPLISFIQCLHYLPYVWYILLASILCIARWPAHLQCFLISCMMSLTFGLTHRSKFLTLSSLQAALSVTLSFFSIFLVVHVSAPYDSTRIIHWLKICFFIKREWKFLITNYMYETELTKLCPGKLDFSFYLS